MSSAGDVTVLRQIIAQYSVAAANQNAWSTIYPIQTTANIVAGGGISLPASYVGTATLGSSGVVTVSTSACTSSSYIFITNKTNSTGGLVTATPGNGSFTLTSVNSGDRSVIQWMIVNSA